MKLRFLTLFLFLSIGTTCFAQQEKAEKNVEVETSFTFTAEQLEDLKTFDWGIVYPSFKKFPADTKIAINFGCDEKVILDGKEIEPFHQKIVGTPKNLDKMVAEAKNIISKLNPAP